MRAARVATAALTLTVACGDDPAGVRDVPLSSTRTIPGLSGEVLVLRTELGVPHLYAGDMLDLARAQGFVTAQDRYVQIELTRRFGGGTLSELLGDLGLSIDYSSRGQGMRFVADRVWANASDDLRARFEAYAAGVNLYVDEVKARRAPLPEEIELLGEFLGVDDPRSVMAHMTGYDIAAAGAVIVSRLGYESIDLEAAKIEEAAQTATASTAALADLRRAGLLLDLVHAVAPVHGMISSKPGVGSSAGGLAPGAGAGAGAAGEPGPPAPRGGLGSPGAPALEPGLLTRATRSTHRLMTLLGKGTRGEFGSNSWAISSKGTGGRGALLANDGHLPLTVPSLFYQQCLDSDYFGETGYSVCGLFFPGLPLLAVGTNGAVAWGQTYLDADITDWYREEITLGAGGLPESSSFLGDQRPLERFEEEYRLPREDDPTSFDTVARPRWTTFDGRWIVSYEGDVVEDPDAPGVVVSDGEYVVPRDVDGDGAIEAISLDWTAFDLAKSVEAVDGFAHARSVAQFIEETKKLIGYGQNIIVADGQGEIAYTAYHGLPCRDGLPKGPEGEWLPGASPRSVLDGTKYGGFEVPSTAEGLVREDAACVVPFEVGPRAITPAAGFVQTANHDPLGYGLDDSLANDPWYIGGPWSLGYRANTIEAHLARIAAGGAATVEDLSRVQGDHGSPLGAEYGPVLLDSLAHAREVAARGASGPDEAREVAAYEALGARAAEVEARLGAWLARGAPAASGVETFYASPTAEDVKDSNATMIFNAWLRAFVAGTLDDEGIDFAFAVSRAETVFRIMHRIVAGRGAGNPGALASFNPETSESVFFDVLGTEPIERSHEVILLALGTALDQLASPQGFGTAELDRWLWGLRHQVRFRALLEEVAAGNPLAGILGLKFNITTEALPLADNLPAGDPRASLEHFPRDGDFFTVDAASGGFSGPYTYSNGPVMRMVISLDGGRISGRNILPGGQSALLGSPHFADQAALWLGNETVPIRYHPEDVVEGAEGGERLVP